MRLSELQSQLHVIAYMAAHHRAGIKWSVAVLKPFHPVSVPNDALFFDVDGTLIDIAERPNDVVVPDSLVAALSELHASMSHAIAFVSGRRIETLDAFFSPLQFAAAGVHGGQIRLAPNSGIETRAAPTLPSVFVAKLYKAAETFSGVVVEDKGLSVALHWRQAPACGNQLGLLLNSIVENEPNVGAHVLEGRFVFEIKPLGINKGDAIRILLEQPEFAGRRPIVLGDDTTDLSAFAMVRMLGGEAFSVGSLMQGANDWFESPQAVRDWIVTLASMSDRQKTA